ncbi:PadR family transcriptional regulator [Umezawaea endophytica]|uniref:PadR family transcriptional regulator n=1 Tax=Umezawaea endophytica TaxID=1654476 RepID=A0A9X3AEL7_9PSEU|nr:PadR family transcriptional regulator [Umezawaea endophytica]MCS7476040.1 PadR family transcriptional regulator [Umezawaea endophytica]
MAKRRKVSNPLALAVLAQLLMGPTHPYEIGRRLTAQDKGRNVKYTRGSLYMVVEQLLKAGFIAEDGTVRDTQRPERTIYALTEDGRAELYDWLRDLVAKPEHEFPKFGVALSLLVVLAPADAVDLLGRRLVALTEEAEQIRADVRQAVDGGLEWVFVVEEEYRLAVLDAEARFVTTLVTRLGEPEYVRKWQEMFEGKT